MKKQDKYASVKLKWEAKIPLEQGLKKTIEYFKFQLTENVQQRKVFEINLENQYINKSKQKVFTVLT